MDHETVKDGKKVEDGDYNPAPQAAPGASAAVGHTIENSIPLSIFPVAADKYCIVFCGLPGRGKTHISRRLARYLSFFHAIPVSVYNVGEYRLKICGAVKDAEWFSSENEAGQEWRRVSVFLYLSKYLGMSITNSFIH